jgi:hypothetical protein
VPSRISHVKRFYGSGEGDERAWVDVERIDQLTRNSGTGPTFQATVQRIRWDDDGEGNDSANGTRSMHKLTVSNPNGPESVDILIIDNCKFSPRQDAGVLRKFRNYDDDNNAARETTSVRIESDDDTSQYVDVEIVDKFHDRDSDGRVIFKMRNHAYEDNENGPGGPPSNPPYRLDPYQAIIGVSWGKKNHHDSGKDFSGYPRYILSANAYLNWRPGEWFVTANALTGQILSSTMTIMDGWNSPNFGENPEGTLEYWVDKMHEPGYGTWSFLFDSGQNQAMLDSMMDAAADYDGDGGGGSTGAGATITWP